MLNYLYGKFPNCNFYGSDIIPQSIQLAKEKTNDSIEYFVDDITKKNNTQLKCDVIISVGVFQIYEDINSLIQNDLKINSLDEFDYSPYNIFDNSLKIEEKKYRIEHLENKIPMVYSIIATKTTNTV